MPESDEGFLRANAEVNEIFDRLREAVEETARGDAQQVSVLEVARRAGLELDERVLGELKVPELVPVIRFIPWDIWFPWRPIWCWWWGFRYPWYRCCPFWWYRCHWYST
jgi:hypothetical protein